jgi:hypothetical protein
MVSVRAGAGHEAAETRARPHSFHGAARRPLGPLRFGVWRAFCWFAHISPGRGSLERFGGPGVPWGMCHETLTRKDLIRSESR